MDAENRNSEMLMHAFRLARSGNYRMAKALNSAFKLAYPDATMKERVYVFSELAKIVKEQNAR